MGAHDWKLDVAVDNYFQFPERYNKEPKQALDRKKIDALFNRYKGNKEIVTAITDIISLGSLCKKTCFDKKNLS